MTLTTFNAIRADLEKMFPRKIVLSVKEVAHALGRTGPGGYEFTRRQLATGALLPRARRLGGRWCLPVAALAEYLHNLIEPVESSKPARASAKGGTMPRLLHSKKGHRFFSFLTGPATEREGSGWWSVRPKNTRVDLPAVPVFGDRQRAARTRHDVRQADAVRFWEDVLANVAQIELTTTLKAKNAKPPVRSAPL